MWTSSVPVSVRRPMCFQHPGKIVLNTTPYLSLSKISCLGQSNSKVHYQRTSMSYKTHLNVFHSQVTITNLETTKSPLFHKFIMEQTRPEYCTKEHTLCMNQIHVLIQILSKPSLFFDQVCNGADNCKDASDEG